MLEDLLKVEEVAERLNLNRRTVLNYVNHNQIKGRRIGRRVYISEEDLSDFMARGRAKKYTSL